MARRAQKRPAGEKQSRQDSEPPAKKIKTQSEIEVEAWENWVYPPQFWDNLSVLNLTRKAVQELNRRNRLQPRPRKKHHVTDPLPFKSIAQFARHGGPDLCDIRGYRPRPQRMSLNSSRPSRATDSAATASTVPTSVTGQTKKSKKSTPYNRDFELHLEEHGVHAPLFSRRPNLKEVRQALKVPRASLSPSRFPEEAFDAFEKANYQANDEDDIVASVIPTILGQPNPGQASARNTVFGNLAPLTDGSIVQAMPDFYDGAHPHELNRSVRAKIGNHVVPSTMLHKPLAPNFFLEVKGPDGTGAVAKRQARYDGAIGSRAMHTLQNYGEEEPKYDGEAHTFSCIYHEEQLQLYAHHVTAPRADKGRPEYHVTRVDSYSMTGNHDRFLEGATAVRNVRDLAKRYRDGFIQAANTREYELSMLVSEDIIPTVEGDDPAGPSVPRTGDNEIGGHMPLQNDPAAGSHDSQDSRRSPPVLQPPINEDNSQGDNNGLNHGLNNGSAVHADEPAIPASSFPAPLNGKRHRQSASPPSTSGDTARPPQGRRRLEKTHVVETEGLPTATTTPASDEFENGVQVVEDTQAASADVSC